MSTESFIILALATWRLSSLFANEGGPGDVFKFIRTKLGVECPSNGECFGRTWLAKGLLCEWCNSIWFGTFLIVMYFWIGNALILIVLPLALSCVTIIVKYLIESLQVKSV